MARLWLFLLRMSQVHRNGMSCYTPSCHAHTCDASLITSVFVISIHTCESNANPLSRMYPHVIETTSCIHTCESNVNPMSWMYSHVPNQVIYITFITREHFICVFHMTNIIFSPPKDESSSRATQLCTSAV